MYSEVVNEHVANAKNVGKPEGCTQTGVVGIPGDGPYIAIHLTTTDRRIEAAGFNTWGCPAAIACGSALTELITGMTLDEARTMTAPQLLQILGGLPEGKEGRADMAVEALNKALHSEEETHVE